MGSTMRGMSRSTAPEKPVKQVNLDATDVVAPQVAPGATLEPSESAVPVSIDPTSEATPEQDLEATTPVLESTESGVEAPSETSSVTIASAESIEQTAQDIPPAEKKNKPKPPAKKSGKTADQKKVTTPKAET